MFALELAEPVRSTQLVVRLAAEDALDDGVRVYHSSRTRARVHLSREHSVAESVTVARLRAPVRRETVPDRSADAAVMSGRKYGGVTGTQQIAVEACVQVRQTTFRTAALHRVLPSVHTATLRTGFSSAAYMLTWTNHRSAGVVT